MADVKLAEKLNPWGFKWDILPKGAADRQTFRKAAGFGLCLPEALPVILIT